MNEQDRKLLLADLCARLPYKVIIKSIGENKIIGLWDLRNIDNLPLPYLRPMSSMTDEEYKEFKDTWEYLKHQPDVCVLSVASYDWLNAHHFDYRGLIEKGLALEAPEGMYVAE